MCAHVVSSIAYLGENFVTFAALKDLVRPFGTLIDLIRSVEIPVDAIRGFIAHQFLCFLDFSALFIYGLYFHIADFTNSSVSTCHRNKRIVKIRARTR